MYKIGFSTNPEKRAKDISWKAGLRVLATIETEDMVMLERKMHSVYHKKRAVSEWFLLTQNDINAWPIDEASAYAMEAIHGEFPMNYVLPEWAMPSKRKQFNVRADRETEALIPAIIAAIKEQTGLEPTQSDLFRMGLVELRRKYGVIPIPETAPIKPAKRKTA